MDKPIGIYTKQERDKLISAELKRVKSIYSDMPKIDLEGCEKLMQDAAFMAITLQELREIISRDGAVDMYQNSATQWGMKKSAAVEVYDKMVNTYMKIINNISDKMLDDAGKAEAGNEAMKYVHIR